MIDINGNEIDPRTKQVIKLNDEGYKPTSEEVAALVSRPAPTPEEIKDQTMLERTFGTQPGPSEPRENPLAEAIKKQVQEQVQKVLSEIDISKMVADAVKDAFK